MKEHGAAIVQRLEDSESSVRVAALKALGTSPEAVMQHGEAIVERLEDLDKNVRRAAVKALGKEAVNYSGVILKRLEDSSSSVRQAAVEALGTSPEAAVAQLAPEVIMYTEHSDPGVAYLAASIAPHVEPAVLAPLLKHRGDVFEALGQLAEHADLLERTMAIDPSLGMWTNTMGQRYIELATFECRRAMQRGLYFLGRFEVDSEPPRHISATAAVLAATDHTDDEKDETVAKSSRRALKAMRDAEQVLTELNGRKDLSGDFVVAVDAVYVDDSVGDDVIAKIRVAAAELPQCGINVTDGLSARLESEINLRIGSSNGDSATRAKDYKYLLVLELADSSLTTTLTHDHIAGKDFLLIRKIIADLAHALDHLHSNDRIHGDCKPLNVVRIGSKWQLIDLDVCCFIGNSFGKKPPSSAYCPPEIAEVMLNHSERLGEYKASVAFDLWSLRCVLFELVFAGPLWHKDQNDNIKWANDLKKLACVDSEMELQKFLKRAIWYDGPESTDVVTAISLFRKLLEPDPAKRIENFEPREDRPMLVVLREPFFHIQGLNGKILDEIRQEQEIQRKELQKHTALLEAIHKRTLTIEGLQHDAMVKLNEHANNLCKCIQAAADDKVPTAFVIFAKPADLVEELSDEVTGGTKKKDPEEIGDTAAAQDDVEGTTSLTERSKNNILKCGKVMLSLYRRGKMIEESIVGTASAVKNAFDDPMGFAREKLKERSVETLYLSLVCECCWTAQPGPYEVTKKNEHYCRRVLPIAKQTVSIMKATNTAASVVKCFFPHLPIPTLTKETVNDITAMIDNLDQESSVDDYKEVQKVLFKQDGERKQGKEDGYCRREFKKFLEEVDPDNKFQKLRRLIVVDRSIWVCHDCGAVLLREEHSGKSYDELRALCGGGAEEATTETTTTTTAQDDDMKLLKRSRPATTMEQRRPGLALLGFCAAARRRPHSPT